MLTLILETANLELDPKNGNKISRGEALSMNSFVLKRGLALRTMKLLEAMYLKWIRP